METLKFCDHVKHVNNRLQKSKPKQEKRIILGLPEELKNCKFQTVDYLLGRKTPKCPMKFDEFQNLQYFSKSDGYHLFLANQKGVKVVLICEIL